MTRYWKDSAIFWTILCCSIFATGRSGALDVQPGKNFRDCPECPEMVVIPAGTFLMGSSEADTERDLASVPLPGPGLATMMGITDRGRAKKFMAYEHPQHLITISKDFALGKYLVTTGEFAAFVRDTGYSTGPCFIWGRLRRPTPPTPSAWSHPGFDQTDRDPVVCVTWKDANAYISWLNRKLEGDMSRAGSGPYRLPSEAEWEYAARAGSQTARWWGDTIGVGNAKCDGCGDLVDKQGPTFVDGRLVYPPCCHVESEQHTVPVGSFPANPYGLYDMLGNATQWTEDCWMETYDGAPSDGSAWTDANCTLRVTRGGSWHGLPWASRSATRAGITTDLGYNDFGFRVAKTLRSAEPPR